MLPPAAAAIHHDTQEPSSGRDTGGQLLPAIAGNPADAGISLQRNGLLMRALGQEQRTGHAAGSFTTKPSTMARRPSTPGNEEPFRPVKGKGQGHLGPRNHDIGNSSDIGSRASLLAELPPPHG
eukprot:9863829-Heterocapsa_arctica.AAC.1